MEIIITNTFQIDDGYNDTLVVALVTKDGETTQRDIQLRRSDFNGSLEEQLYFMLK